MTNIIIILFLFSIFGMASLLIIYSFLKKKYQNTFNPEKLVVKRKEKLSDYINRFYQFSYSVLMKIPILNRYIKKIRLKLEMVNDYTEYQIRLSSSKIAMNTIIFMVLGILILTNLVSDAYTSVMIVFGIIFINDKIVDFYITRSENKILRQIADVFTEIRHSFHEHGMIEIALQDAIDNLGEKEIVPQIKRIKEALLADNPEVELEKYYDTAPSRFLKLFAGLSYLVMELGDRKVDGVSVYLKNLNNILNDVYLEILKRDKIDYLFRSLTIIAVAPIFFINIIKGWAQSSFPALVNFYNSSIGFVLEVLIVGLIFLSYMLIRMLREDNEQLKFDRVGKLKWQERLYRNKFIRMLIDSFIPKASTKKYVKETKIIKNTGSFLTIEWLYVNKIMYSFIAIIVSLILFINIHSVDTKAIKEMLSSEFTAFGKLSPEQEQAAKGIAVKDSQIVEKYKGNSKVTDYEIKAELEAQGQENVDKNAIARVKDKLKKRQATYLKWWEVIISLAIGYGAYNFPVAILYLKMKLRELEKENEIMQFQSIILMLMYIERINVETILEWLQRFSYAFKEQISTCLNNYEAGAIEALEQLKEDAPYKTFTRIIDALESAVERIPVSQAFDELETERTFYYEKRKEANERLINKKVNMGKALGFTPMVLLIGGFLVIPLIVVSVSQMGNYFTQMSGL